MSKTLVNSHFVELWVVALVVVASFMMGKLNAPLWVFMMLLVAPCVLLFKVALALTPKDVRDATDSPVTSSRA